MMRLLGRVPESPRVASLHQAAVHTTSSTSTAPLELHTSSLRSLLAPNTHARVADRMSAQG